MNKKIKQKVLTAAEYLELFENFDPAKWREGTPEELAEHRERAKDAVIVEIEEIDANDTVEIEEIDANDTVENEEIKLTQAKRSRLKNPRKTS